MIKRSEKKREGAALRLKENQEDMMLSKPKDINTSGKTVVDGRSVAYKSSLVQRVKHWM